MTGRDGDEEPPMSPWVLLGIDPNFTGELSTAEYMDELRGKQ